MVGGGSETASVARMTSAEDSLVVRYRWTGDDPKPVATTSVHVVQTGACQGIVLLMPPLPFVAPSWSSDNGAQITRLEVQPDTARPAEDDERMSLAGPLRASVASPAGSHLTPIDDVTYDSGDILVDVGVSTVQCLVVGKGMPTYTGTRILLVADLATIRVAATMAEPH
jgi:hypothetical protein